MTEESTMVNRQKRLRKRNDIGEDVGIYVVQLLCDEFLRIMVIILLTPS